MKVNVVENVLKVNDELAAKVRERLQAAAVSAINFISAPGSGKTTLIECALRNGIGGTAIGVIEGDPDTSLDAERIAALDTPVVQVNTAGGCHLEANLIMRALESFDLESLDLLLIENVGNLVCPVSFDLGETKRVAVVSTPEGHDKPAKYPMLFRVADLVVLNKVDLLPYLDFDEEFFTNAVRKLNPGAPILRVSCRSGEGIGGWREWLRSCVRSTEIVQ